MHRYKLLAKKGEGTFSEVIRAKCLTNNREVAIKVMRNKFESLEQVNSLREIQALRRLSPDAGIIKLYEVLFDEASGRLALVFELMQMNLYELIRGRKNFLPEAQIKSILYQVLRAVDRMHRNSIFHRDLKPENILVTPQTLGGPSPADPVAAGNNLLVKVADFGSCRGIYSKQPYTEYIATRWYRAPECLLTSGYYSFRMDLWAIGCIAFEIIALFPLFPGSNELDQIERIHNIMGTPDDEILGKFKRFATHIDFNFAKKKGAGIAPMIPHVDQHCIDLIQKLLAYDPEERMSARQALRHPYFRELRHADKKREKAHKLSKSGGDASSDVGDGPRDLQAKFRKNKAGVRGGARGGMNRKNLPHIPGKFGTGGESEKLHGPNLTDPRNPVALPNLPHQNKYRKEAGSLAQQPHAHIRQAPYLNKIPDGPAHSSNNHTDSSGSHAGIHAKNKYLTHASNDTSTIAGVADHGNSTETIHSKSKHRRSQNSYGPIVQGDGATGPLSGANQVVPGKSKRGGGQAGVSKKYGHSKAVATVHKAQYATYKSTYQSPYSQKYLARSRVPGIL